MILDIIKQSEKVLKNPLLVSSLKNLEKLQKKGSVFQGKDFTDDNLKILKYTGFVEPNYERLVLCFKTYRKRK